MDERPILERNDSPDKDSFYDKLIDTDAVASATECTGLMYRPPENEYEAESYSDIYVVPQVVNEAEKELRK